MTKAERWQEQMSKALAEHERLTLARHEKMQAVGSLLAELDSLAKEVWEQEQVIAGLHYTTPKELLKR